MTDFVVAIPARFAAQRLPGKPLCELQGRPLIAHVVDRALEAGANRVVVATDDVRIAEAVAALKVEVVMTSAEHPSGTDRLAEVARKLALPEGMIVVNLQGDEPLAPPSGIRTAVAALRTSDAPMATLATPIECARELFDPHCVKVVVDTHGRALYFSRAPIPWAREHFRRDQIGLPPSTRPWLRHIGLYAYRAGFLETFTRLPRSPLEDIEALEQLRVLDAGYRIAVAIAPEAFPAGVDTPEDLARVAAIMAACKLDQT
ncbi:MAG TPA: 3-deoxy-manno-octulosonate cytidylyltransferase [Xanthomonadaceae bacterium]|nr:3-deoxy-manno-octulosonate cytidylyltransferase [Xanthomonadaceae bacterium]